MDLETGFQIHTNVSNFEMVSPPNHMNSQNVSHICDIHVLYLKIDKNCNFQLSFIEMVHVAI